MTSHLCPALRHISIFILYMQIDSVHRMFTCLGTILFVFLKFTIWSIVTPQSFFYNARVIFTIQFVCLATATFLAKRWIINWKRWIYRLLVGIESNMQSVCLRFEWFGDHSAKMFQSGTGVSRKCVYGRDGERERQNESFNQDFTQFNYEYYLF